MATAKKRTSREPRVPQQRTSPAREATAAVAARQPRVSWGPYAALAAGALVVVCWAYGPAMHGPFLFDDNGLPFALPNFDAPLAHWLRGVRPLLMLTYWLNVKMSGSDTFSYHAVNLLFHLAATGLMFFIVRKLLECSGCERPRLDLLAGFVAAIFLLHPVETEAVAYLAGRSDGLSVMLLLAAYAVFLYRRNLAVSWRDTLMLLLIFAASLLAKEHTIVLPALFLLTDYWWNPGFSLAGARRNWKLYAPLAVGAMGGFWFFLPLIRHGSNAGFGLKDLTWYQYFFTQCRALFVYSALFLFPVHQSADWDFPMSKTIFDRGAIIGLIALLALAGLAWRYRRTYRLASFGFFTYLLLMAPTSSFLPIRDAIAERRLYLSMLGLLLILVDFLGRWKLERKTLATVCAVVVLIQATGTYGRAKVWSSELALWQDTTEKTPGNWRAHFHLASAYYNAGHCDTAVNEFQNTTKLRPPDYDLLVDWALALDCLNQTDAALAKLRQAAALEQTAHVYSQIGMVYGKRKQWAEALDALATAEKLDPNFATTYVYRGLVHTATNQPEAAIQDYRRALTIDPRYQQALDGVAQAQTLLARH
jgi:tetratricopeptide (TPR) repeat protein